MEELLSSLEKHKTTFLLALTGDLHDKGDEHEVAINKIGSQIDDLRVRDERRAIAEWLQNGGADPSTNHNAARKKHAQGTGDWLLNLDTFQNWKDSDSGFLWLNGISGAGKTVLSSSVIEQLKQKQGKDKPEPKLAYFYFDFSDEGKQTAQGCFLSLVRQLFDQSNYISEELLSLYNENRQGEPSLERLVDVFISMLSDGPSTSIVIDALDECKALEGDEQRDTLYEVMRDIKSKTTGAYRIFIASRPELDIQRELIELGVTEVNVEQALVDEDIRSHIHSLLPKEARFKKWPENVKKEMEDTLVRKSNGM